MFSWLAASNHAYIGCRSPNFQLISAMRSEDSQHQLGLLAALAALVLWGVFPIFWRQLGEVDALVVVAHRVFWSFSFLLLALPAILAWSDSETRQVLRKSIVSGRVWCIYWLAAGFIAVNWLTFVWAVNHERVLEASLGYYINPLLNVLLGVGLLGERLSRLQWTAIGSATLGVAVLTVAGGGLPWVSLVLACTFSLYSLVKKKAPLPALVGLLFETATLLIPAAMLMVYLSRWAQVSVLPPTAWLGLMLILGGTVTIAPLALFAFAAKRVALSTLGILQYVAPTMQFLLGVFAFGETFAFWQLLGFAFVWNALLIYLVSTRKSIGKANLPREGGPGPALASRAEPIQNSETQTHSAPSMSDQTNVVSKSSSDRAPCN